MPASPTTPASRAWSSAPARSTTICWPRARDARRGAEYGSVALPARVHTAAARRDAARSAVRGAVGEREPGDGVREAAPAGAGGNHQRRADRWGDLADAEGKSGGEKEEVRAGDTGQSCPAILTTIC